MWFKTSVDWNIPLTSKPQKLNHENNKSNNQHQYYLISFFYFIKQSYVLKQKIIQTIH